MGNRQEKRDFRGAMELYVRVESVFIKAILDSQNPDGSEELSQKGELRQLFTTLVKSCFFLSS